LLIELMHFAFNRRKLKLFFKNNLKRGVSQKSCYSRSNAFGNIAR